VQAAQVLLGYAWGKPRQVIEANAEAAGDHWSQHLLAARLVAAELRLERAAASETTGPLIEAAAESQQPNALNLFEPALE
jgi:hypothetical protein